MRPVSDREFPSVKNSQCYRMFSLNLRVRIYMLLAGCHKGNVLESKVLLVVRVYVWNLVRGKTCQEEGFVALLLCHAKPCQEIEIVVLIFKFGFHSQGTSKDVGCGLISKFGFLIDVLARHIKGCKLWPNFQSWFLIVSLLPKECFLVLCNENCSMCDVNSH